jgi:hypothetical protein
MNFLQKGKKTAQAFIGGYGDYSKQVAGLNQEAESNLSGKMYGSSEAKAGQVSDEISRLKKERNISLRNSVRTRLGLQ